MRCLLLVGASGFLGQQLEEFYKNNGWKVLTLGRSIKSDYVFDSEALDSINDIVISDRIDRIIHAAAINEVEINKNIGVTYSVNVILTRYLMELARKHRIPEFVYISTFHVYGKQVGVVGPSAECLPLNDYGLTHLLSEKIVSNTGASYGIKTLIVRPTNIYGIPACIESFDRWSLVPFAFSRSAKFKNEIIIKSSGLQLRNFVSVEDVISATLLVGCSSIVDAYGIDTMSIRNFALRIVSVLHHNFQKQVNVEWSSEGVEVLGEEDYLAFGGDLNYVPKGDLDAFICDFYKVMQ